VVYGTDISMGYWYTNLSIFLRQWLFMCLYIRVPRLWTEHTRISEANGLYNVNYCIIFYAKFEYVFSIIIKLISFQISSNKSVFFRFSKAQYLEQKPNLYIIFVMLILEM